MKTRKDIIQSTEIDSDGAWIYLKSGYQWDGAHSLHEDTMAQAKKRLVEVSPCHCRDCETVPEKPQHTPTPWTHNPEMSDSSISGPDGVIARAVHSWDAAFIVRAVNAHEEMLSALVAVHNDLVVNEDHTADCNCRVAQAIAKAEGRHV